MLLLVPGMHVRLCNPLKLSDAAADKMTGDLGTLFTVVKKYVKADEAVTKIFERMVSEKGSDVHSDVVTIVNVLLIWAREQTKQSYAAKFFYDIIGYMELSIGAFEGEDVIALGVPVLRSRAHFALTARSSFPVVRVQDFSPDSGSWTRYPFELARMQWPGESAGDYVPRMKALATVLSCVELASFRIDGSFSQTWKDYVCDPAMPHAEIIKTIASDCLYPLFLSYNNVRSMQDGVEPGFDLETTDLIFHNECLVEIKAVSFVPGISQTFLQYMADLPSISMQSMLRAIAPSDPYTKYLQ
jgi:hypothetical protein